MKEKKKKDSPEIKDMWESSVFFLCIFFCLVYETKHSQKKLNVCVMTLDM